MLQSQISYKSNRSNRSLQSSKQYNRGTSLKRTGSNYSLPMSMRSSQIQKRASCNEDVCLGVILGMLLNLFALLFLICKKDESFKKGVLIGCFGILLAGGIAFICIYLFVMLEIQNK